MTRYNLPEQIDHVDTSKPLIDDTVIKGSYKVVLNIDARDSIPLLKRELHSLVCIIGDVVKEFKGATIEDADWTDDANWVSFTALPGVILIDDGEEITIKDKNTNATMAVIDRNGQFKSYGRQGVANGSFNTYTYDGYIRIEQNTLQGNFYLKMYDFDNNLKVHIDTAGISTLQGLSVADNNLTDVKELQFSNDITFTDEQKEAMPIGTTFWDSVNKTLTTKTGTDTFLQHGKDVLAKSENLSDLENRQTSVNNLFDSTNLALGQTLIKDEYGNMVAGNAGGGASQDSIEFPVPTAYTYTGDYITKVVETITNGTIEKRLRYYISASPIVDGSPDIMEYKNSVTNFWARATYNYTAGKLTSITTETIIAWTI